MSAVTDVSQEYAAALFAIARDAGTDYTDDLRLVEQVFRDEPLYGEMLSSPGIPMSERTEAIRQALGNAVAQPVLSFVQVLCRSGEIRQLQECIAAYVKLEDEAKRRDTAQVTSAFPLDESQQAALCEKLERITGRRVTLKCAVDPDLLGGVIVRIDGQILDGSLKRRLHDIKEVIDT